MVVGSDKTLDTTAFTTSYLDLGNGEPVIFLHGADAGASGVSQWFGVAPHFSSLWRVLIPDLAGYGNSSAKVHETIDVSSLLYQMVEFIENLKLVGVTLIGTSFGAELALAIAALYPQKVKRLVVVGAAVSGYSPVSKRVTTDEYRSGMENLRALKAIYPFDKSLVTSTPLEGKFPLSTPPNAQQIVKAELVAEIDSFLLTRVTSAGDCVSFPESLLAHVLASTLVMHGREDCVVDARSSWLTANRLSNADMFLFGNCGHFAQNEKMETFVELIQSFLLRT